MAEMIIQKPDGKATIHTCPCFKLIADAQMPHDATITKFYSSKEAQEAGWRKTNHWYYSQYGNNVWVCPDCISKKPKAFNKGV